MFELSEELNRLNVRVLILGAMDEQLLIDKLKAIIPENSSAIEYEYLQDTDGTLAFTDLKPADFTVIALCGDTSYSRDHLSNNCKKAAALSEFTVLFVPVYSYTNGNIEIDHPASQALKSEPPDHLSSLVDTLILTPCKEPVVPIEIISAIPLLLSGSSFIGIDVADIKYVLADSASNTGKQEAFCYIASHEYYTGANDIQSIASTLATRVSNMAKKPLQNCVASICLAKNGSTTLDNLQSAVEEIYNGICSPDTIRVFGAPALYDYTDNSAGVSMMCIAGPLSLEHDPLKPL